MELFFAVFLCLFFLAVFVISQIYLEMDKNKVRAIACIKKMTANLDEWVKRTVEMAESSDAGGTSADDLRTLAQDYSSFNKSKEMPKKIPLVNSMAALSGTLSEANGTKTARLLDMRADAAANLGLLRTEYNNCVKQLNGSQKKGISGAVGKLFRMTGLEELCELS